MQYLLLSQLYLQFTLYIISMIQVSNLTIIVTVEDQNKETKCWGSSLKKSDTERSPNGGKCYLALKIRVSCFDIFDHIASALQLT